MRGSLERSLLGIAFGFIAGLVVLSASCLSWSDTQQTPAHIPDTDTLRLYGVGPTNLDPALSQETTSHTYVMQIFSGLVAFDKDLNLVPDIAENWTVETGEAWTIYTFHLRPGVRFHDGTQVTAQDFKYSWERACRPETRSPTASTYLNDIVGVEEMLAGTAQSIQGVVVVEDLTLRVTIDQPKSYFLAKLTYPVAFVIDEADVSEGADWWRQPNGTGPYTLNEWATGDLLLLERNELYYRQKAKTRYVAFLLWGGAPMQMYERGEIDATSVSLYNLERVLDETNPLNDQLQLFPEFSLTFISFNLYEPPFDDAKVRQALGHALNRNRVVTQVLKDSVAPAYGVLPPGMPGYDETFEGLDYDLEKARQLLGEAGYPDGSGFPTVVFTVPGDGGYVPSWLVAVLHQWVENLNVDIEIRQIESDSYYPLLDREKDDFFLFSWIADYPDPQDFLEVLFRSDTAYNYGGYSSPELDDLLSQAAVEHDDSVRLDLYRQGEQMLIEDAACVPLWFGQNYVLVKPNVTGYFVSPLGVPLLAGVSVQD